MILRRLYELPREVYEHYQRSEEFIKIRKAIRQVDGRYRAYVTGTASYELWAKSWDGHWRYQVYYIEEATK